MYVEYFIEVLTPATELSLHFQCEEIDIVGAAHGIKSFFRIMGKLKESSALNFSTGRVKKFLDVVSSENTDANSAFSKTWLLPELRRVLSCESPAVFLHFPLEEKGSQLQQALAKGRHLLQILLKAL